MKEESLEIVANKCYMAISNAEIDNDDKIELLMNVNKFLGRDYEENKLILNLHNENKKIAKELGIQKQKIIKAGTTVELKDFFE